MTNNALYRALWLLTIVHLMLMMMLCYDSDSKLLNIKHNINEIIENCLFICQTTNYATLLSEEETKVYFQIVN